VDADAKSGWSGALAYLIGGECMSAMMELIYDGPAWVIGPVLRIEQRFLLILGRERLESEREQLDDRMITSFPLILAK
jgi:hypothetical protein